MATPAALPTGSILDEKLKKSSPGKIGMIIFGVMLIGGLIYIVNRLWTDLSIVHTGSIFPYFLLASRCLSHWVLSSSTDFTIRRMRWRR